MKRILSLIMALCICMCSVSPVFAEETSLQPIQKSAYREFLENMKLLDFEFENETKIDRKLFAYLLCKVTNSQTLSDDIWEFPDVDERCRFNTDIECAAGFGWMKGANDGNFYPHNSVSLNDATLAFVKMLGYGEHADNSGGYPSGYLSMANRLGLLDGINVKNHDALSADEIFGITYNFLHTKVIRQYIFGTDTTAYTENPEISAMEFYLDIKYKGGILEENYVTALTGKSSLGADRIKVGGETFKCDETLFRNLIGYYVNCYYKAEEPQTAIYIYAHHKKKYRYHHLW